MRRNDAAVAVRAQPSRRAIALWNEAELIRQEWLRHALSTEPADRSTAQSALISLYARVGRPRPRIEWVDSPYKALPLVAGLPTLDVLYRWINDPPPPGAPPLASDLAALASSLRSALWEGLVAPDPDLAAARTVRRAKNEPWPELPPRDALAFGVPLGVVLDRGVRRSLFRSLADGLYLRARAALAETGLIGDDAPLPVCWYGQHDAAWVAYYDTLQRLGLARYRPRDLDHFADWAQLVRSCGWWWPGEQVCVVVERPSVVRTEPVPDADYGEIRLVRDGLTYRDGWRPGRNAGVRVGRYPPPR